MIILKLMLKVVLLPFLLLTIVCQWIGTFFTGIASVVLGLLSFLCWSIAILSYLMGICTGQETIQILLLAFFAFIIPKFCNASCEVIASFHRFLGQIIRS